MSGTEPVTRQFEFVIGVNPGYLHQNQETDPLQAAINVWRQACLQCVKDGGLYVSAVFTLGKCLWPDGEERKCPAGGEDVVVIRGIRNSARCPYPARWRRSLSWICAETQRRLQQTTSTLTVHEVQFRYNLGC